MLRIATYGLLAGLVCSCSGSPVPYDGWRRNTRAVAPGVDEGPAVASGQVGQTAHLFYLPTINAKLCGQSIFDANVVAGPRARAPRVLVLSFAADYCEPCKKELKAYAANYRALQASGAAFVVVVVDEDRAAGDRLVRYLTEDVRLRVPIVEDTFQLLARKYSVQTLPHTVIIGPDGRVRAVRTGYEGQMSLDALLAQVAAAR